MSNPLRKEHDEELTTADIANQSRIPSSSATEVRPKLVQSDRPDSGTAVIARSGSSAAREEIREMQGGGQSESQATPLFPDAERQELKNSWERIQVGFVDEPRSAVEQADSLVASAMKRLAEVFAQERSNLEQQWGRGDNVSTEDLRLALQRYRSFFHRLLAI
jgi:glutathione S-transferase